MGKVKEAFEKIEKWLGRYRLAEWLLASKGGVVMISALGVAISFLVGWLNHLKITDLIELVFVTLAVLILVPIGTVWIFDKFGIRGKKMIVAGIWFLCVGILSISIGVSLCYVGRSSNQKEMQSHLAPQSSQQSSEEPAFKEKEEPTFKEKIDTVRVEMGGNIANYDIDKLGKQKVTPFQLFGFSPVIYFEKRRLYIDVRLYGGPGNPAVEIVRNEFTVRKPRWDRNFNADALEIVDENQKPIFQIIYKSPTHIVINGIFPAPSGSFLGANESGIIYPVAPANFLLKRIFKYPSSLYRGQLADN